MNHRYEPDSLLPGNPADGSVRPKSWRRHGDAGVDDLARGSDGTVDVLQYKIRQSSGGHVDDRRSAEARTEGGCPECAAEWPELDDDIASNLTVAASGAWLGGPRADLQVNPITMHPTGLNVVMDTCLLATGIVDRLTPSGTGIVYQAKFRAADAPLDFTKIVRLLKHWRGVSSKLVLVVESKQEARLLSALLDSLAGRVAECAVRAAYQARTSVVHDDPKTSGQVVASFATRWLGLQPTPENIDAVGNALLQAPLDGVHPEGDHAAVRRLPLDVRDQRRSWRDLGKTRLHGARIGSLDRPLTAGTGAEQLTLLDVIAAGDELGRTTWDWDDERVGRVLKLLRPDERRVALAVALRYADTWEQAAVCCGLPSVFGERVRRKLKRRGAQLTERIATVQRRAA